MTPLRALRAPGVGGLLALALVARLPVTAIGLLLVLQARALGATYALAGLTTGAFAIGAALGAVLQARLVDRIGQSVVLLTGSACTAGVLVAITRVPASHSALLVPLACLCGAAVPPIGPCLRAIWSRTLSQEQRRSAFSLEASLQELAFLFGPLIFISLATSTSPSTSLLALAAVLFATSFGFALTSQARATRRGATRVRARSAPLRNGPVRTLLAASFVMGVAISSVEIGIVAFADHEGAKGATGMLYGLWIVASLLAGLLDGYRRRKRHPVAEAQLLMLALAVAGMLLALAPSVPLLALALVPAGAAVAPLFSRVFGLTGDVAPPEGLTESYAWTTAGLLGGVSIGASITGALDTALGVHACFLVGTVAGGAGAAMLLMRGGAFRLATRQ
ncbi:MAG: MFS transporter [Conexibacter sp.]